MVVIKLYARKFIQQFGYEAHFQVNLLQFEI